MSEHVVIVASDGVADLTPVAKFMAARQLRLKAAADRIEAVKAQGYVPEVCGDAIPEAPARGAIRVFQPMSLFPDGKDDWVARPSGYRGRSAMQRADVFDVMAAKAASNGKPPPFTRDQVAAGRYYRDLVERHACAGVRCSSVEALRSGGGGSGSFIDAVLRDREEIERIRRRIGSGIAMAIRKIRPSRSGLAGQHHGSVPGGYGVPGGQADQRGSAGARLERWRPIGWRSAAGVVGGS